MQSDNYFIIKTVTRSGINMWQFYGKESYCLKACCVILRNYIVVYLVIHHIYYIILYYIILYYIILYYIILYCA